MAEVAVSVVNNGGTLTLSELESSDHRVNYPGEKLTASEITCGQGNNILHVAAKYRGTTDVRNILDSHPLLANETNAKGDTPLHIAARLGKLDVVEILVGIIVKYEKERLAEAEAEYKNAQEEYVECMEKINSKGNNPVDEAELVKRLVEYEKKRLADAGAEYKNAQDEPKGRLRKAQKVTEIQLGYEKKRLDDAETKHNRAKDEYEKCLQKVSNKGSKTLHEAELVERLVEAENKRLEEAKTKYKHAQDMYEQKLRKANNEGNTALHEAVMNGHLDIAELLIIEDPTLTSLNNKDGESPLFLSVDGGYEKTARQILKTFPKCSVSGRNGLAIMHQIVIRTHPQIIDKPFVPAKIAKVITSIFGQHDDQFVEEVMKILGSEVLEIPDEFGWMPHHYAAKMGFSSILEIILRTSHSLAYIKDKEGMSALHISAKNGHTHVIKTIIKECPDVCELLDNKGRTALHIAVEHKQLFAFHALLNTTAFNDLLNEQDNEGNTALHLACIYGQYHIIKQLLGDRRTNKRIINKKGMTAFDYINRSSILGPFDKFLIKNQWKIKNPGSLQALRDTKENATFLETDHQSNQECVSASVVKENEKTNKDNESVENTAGINVLVATIIASITFAAAMNMPGSYDSSTGLSNLREKTSFRKFLAFDSLAFGCSSAVMVTHFAVKAHLKWRGKAYGYPIHLTTLLTFMSLVWTMLAFTLGTYSVLFVPNSEYGYVLPGNLALTAFIVTLIYLFQPVVTTSRTFF